MPVCLVLSQAVAVEACDRAVKPTGMTLLHLNLIGSNAGGWLGNSAHAVVPLALFTTTALMRAVKVGQPASLPTATLADLQHGGLARGLLYRHMASVVSTQTLELHAFLLAPAVPCIISAARHSKRLDSGRSLLGLSFCFKEVL